jgi:hypothetical protein
MKLSMGQRISGGGGILLLLFMQFLPWYGTKDEYTPNGILLPARHVTVNAWRSFKLIDILLALTIAIVLFSVVRIARGRPSQQLRATASIAATGAGALATILLLYRVMVPIPNVARWYGLFLALLAAIAIVAGGLVWMAEEGAAVAGVTVADVRRRLGDGWRRLQQARRR